MVATRVVHHHQKCVDQVQSAAAAVDVAMSATSDEGGCCRVGFAARLYIYAWAVLLASWVFLRRLFSVVWSRHKATPAPPRDVPPPALCDSSIGRHNYIKLQGVKFHYVEAGDKCAPPLLLLHGFPDCWLGWEAQITLLSVSYHVYALDLKGFGDSDKPGIRLHYRLPHLLSELRAFLLILSDNPSRRNVTILAHDLGGLLAWFLLHDSPGLIERMVIVSATHPNIFWDTLPKNCLLNYKWMCLAQVPWLPEQEALKGDMMFLEQYCPHLKSSSLLETYKYVFSRHEDWTGPLNYFRNLMFCRVPENCGFINTPILIITGNKDPQIPLEAIVRSSDWCTNATVKIIDGGGHFPHQEYSEQFNRHLLKFLICDREKHLVGKNGIEAGVTGAARGLVGRLFGAVHLFT
ncbi:epoxide hydrolase 4-like [Arctopsyche grandis]|uniref:epoxide hydrolase 4-like n=1 Tax=Arctopsyche grandis TaxID=121162 RepID=UPI00406D7216